MWRAPSEPHDGPSDAAAPRRSRWLDIVNLVASILILVIFVSLFPLFSAQREQQALVDRVARLEQRVALLETTLSAVSSATNLAMGRLHIASSQGAAGFWVRNTGPNAAKNVSVLVALDAVAPSWQESLGSIHRLSVRTFPPSLDVTVQARQIPTMPPELGGSTVVGDNALELTLETLPPGGEWYIVVELSNQFPVEACSVVRSGRVQVSPSRFAPFGLSAGSLEAMQVEVGQCFQEGAMQQAWVADLAVTAECLNCGEPQRAGARLSALSGLAVRSTPAVLLGGAGSGYTVAWDTTLSAALRRPPGALLPGYCHVEGTLFQEASLFSTSPGSIFLYEFSPTSAAVTAAVSP